MKFDFHTVAGDYLGSTEKDGQQVAEGETISSNFDNQSYSEWVVVAMTPPLDDVQKVILTPRFSTPLLTAAGTN